jgi:mannose-6-phosphate isomerase
MLRLPRDVALGCVDRRACTGADLDALRGRASGSLLPSSADGFFRATRLADGDEVTGFAVLVVVDGEGALTGGWGRRPVRRGETLVLPHAAGPTRVTGPAAVVGCTPAG